MLRTGIFVIALSAALSPALTSAQPFVPPDKMTAKCEDAVSKNLSKLASCMTKCQIKQADFALKGQAFDVAACETGTGTPVSCRAAYDAASASLVAKGICPTCLGAAAQSNLADQMDTVLANRQGDIYCAGTTPLPAAQVTVAPNGMLTFSPQTVTINAGETVEWVWSSSGHNVVSGTGCIADNQFCSPTDSSCATAPVSTQGATYTHTFTTSGTYHYFCNVHCALNMVGTVIVQ